MDGKIQVWDPRTKEPVTSWSFKGDCWSVAFGNSHGDERTLCAGFDNGDLYMFDLRKNSIMWTHHFDKGICCIEFDRKDIEMNKLGVSLLKSEFQIFDLRTFNTTKGYSFLSTTAHDSTIWTIRHLPQNRDIWSTTGGDGSFNLWKYSYPKDRRKKEEDSEEFSGVMGEVRKIASGSLSSQPVLSLDWNKDMEGLGCAVSLDQIISLVYVSDLNA
eukprot:TRINITY_DN8716_c0_g1_i3.p1 TRINITY_DN8716_c0_g1~~TRINITY_DN8716_c0_g1_i3.p1  ORF type:complete len:215 (-),score=44.00 TRINITY_DN8716_c0_g1_i3:154-798(-)